MSVQVVVLGSGSGGNSVVVHDGINGIMVDAGFSRGELLSRMDQAGVDSGIIRAICVTHAHSDHVLALADLVEYLDVPAYISAGTYKVMNCSDLVSEHIRMFTGGDSFECFPFLVNSFDVSHDIGAPVGFVVNFNGRRIAVATDLGVVDVEVATAMKGADAVLLESNHDATMLASSSRHQTLKDRISGDNGHLSNQQCAEALKKIVTSDTSQVVLCHLSRDCNTPELAMKSAKIALPRYSQVRISTASQNEVGYWEI